MEKIKIQEHKKLRLVNVLAKELRGVLLENLDEEIQKFTNFLDVTKIQTKGPLITKTLPVLFMKKKTIWSGCWSS